MEEGAKLSAGIIFMQMRKKTSACKRNVMNLGTKLMYQAKTANLFRVRMATILISTGLIVNR